MGGGNVRAAGTYDQGISGCIDFQGVVDAVISPNGNNTGRDYFLFDLIFIFY